MRTITHSPVRPYSIWEAEWLRGTPIDFAPAPMPHTGPFQLDTLSDLDEALLASDLDSGRVRIEPLEPRMRRPDGSKSRALAIGVSLFFVLAVGYLVGGAR